MKRKLPSYAMQNFNNASKRNGIYAFLIILSMTFTSYAQTNGITFNCTEGVVEFGAPDGEKNGFASWSSSLNQSGAFSLYYNDESGALRWEVYGPDSTGDILYFFSNVFVNDLPSCDFNDWSTGPNITCSSFSISCSEICDGIDNDGDGEIDEGLEGCTPPAIIQYCNEAETKVLICHNGKEICVSINAVDAHIPAHEGDAYGPCASAIANNQEEAVDNQELTKDDPTTIGVKYWPNPSNDVFNVKMITPNFEDNVNLQVYDINGRLVHSNVIRANENYQFGNRLSNGIYFAKLTQAGTSKVLKVVKH